MARTLEEIEAIHAARAERSGQPAPSVVDDDDEPNEHLDDLTPPPPAGDYEAEIASLRQQLAAAHGRAAPEQRRAEEYRQFYEEERRAREREAQERSAEIQALRDQLDAAQAQTALEDILTPDERDMIDPTQLAIFTKLADAAASRRAPRVNAKAEALQALQEHEAQQLQAYRTEVLTDPTRGVASLGTLAHDPSFQAWLNHEDNADFDPLVNSMLQARSKKEIDRYAKAVSRRISQFKESSRTPAASRPTDARQSLTASMQRRPRQATDAEMNNQLAEVRRLSKSRNPADRKRAGELLDSLN